MSKFSMQHMSKSDINEVEAIEKEIFSLPWSEKSFIDACEAENNVYIVCRIDGKVAGYCGMWTVLGEGNITNMAVAEKYRKQGVGLALMEEMEKCGRQKDVNIFFLEVRQSNKAAIHLYEKMGYKDIGCRKNFYERPVEDAIIMSKICEE